MKLGAASICVFLALLAMSAPPALLAQNAEANPTQNPAQNPTIPTITYERLWDAYTPQDINITVEQTGRARYISTNPLKTPDEKQTNPDYTLEFTMSERTRQKLFRDAKEANYFHGDFSYKKHPVASTGKKTLTYADQDRHYQTTFDYSDNKAISEISDILQGISYTLEHGRKLQYLHRFDKLGLEDELKGMEEAAKTENLQELQLIAPTLKSIADDTAVLNIARERAKRLLQKIPSR
ncbi:MAG TPA: hypothetical protein VFB76_17215 [Candidatus Angelobacter sp.]|nr:hypothetical protein [Candidatus Angelobacter sp.]